MEKTPGEVLIDLYTDVARIRSLSVEEVPGPKAAMGEAVLQYGVERGGIGELSDGELANIGRSGLQAYFAEEDQRQAEDRLYVKETAAIAALEDFVSSHLKDDMRVTQIINHDIPMIYVPDHKPVSSAVGRLTMGCLFFPYTSLQFHRRLWSGLYSTKVSSAEVFRGNSLKPRAAIEFL